MRLIQSEPVSFDGRIQSLLDVTIILRSSLVLAISCGQEEINQLSVRIWKIFCNLC